MTRSDLVLAVLVLSLAGFTAGMGQPLSGIYTVGGGGTYATIGAAVNDLNTRGVNGPVTFELIDASYASEIAPIVIQVTAPDKPTATNRVVIKPAGGITATIEAAGVNTPVFKIFGTDHIVIEGSNSGGSSRDLTIRNTSATQGANTVWIASSGATPTRGVTIANCILWIASVQTANLILCDGNSRPSAGFFEDILIHNNQFRAGNYGIYVAGLPAGSIYSQQARRLTITSNTMIAVETDSLQQYGVYLLGVDSSTVADNVIGDFKVAQDQIDAGIVVGQGCRYITVERNIVRNLFYTNGNNGGPKGIAVATSSGTTDASVAIVNNMISTIAGDGRDYTLPTDEGGASYNPAGIWAGLAPTTAGGQSGLNIYYNTIYLHGNTLNATNAYSIGIALDSGSFARVKNNVVVNTEGAAGGAGGALGIAAHWSSSQFLELNNNNYSIAATSGTNSIGKIGATDYGTLADWQAASGGDANSGTRDVTFVSPTDLHLAGPSIGDPLLAGVQIPGITTDIDLEPRIVPYMGADEAAGIVLPPPAPVATAASNVTGSTFDATWNASPNATGYRLDVATDTAFTAMVAGYEDLDVGNVTSRTVTGVVAGGLYSYRVRAYNGIGTSQSSNVISVQLSLVFVEETAPMEFALLQNTPNPFNPTTSIRFAMPKTGAAKMCVYDLLGQEIVTLVDDLLPAGRHEVVWNGRNHAGRTLPSGVYLYTLNVTGVSGTPEFSQVRKMVLMK